MTFRNHAPINFTNAETVAKIDLSGEFDIHNYQILKGKQYHLVLEYCPPGECRGCHFEYLFGARTLDEVVAFIREQAGNLEADVDPETAFQLEIEYRWAGKMLERLGAAQAA